MKIVKEFKEFAVKGNMIDMAIGIIIGTAFNNVVQTLVKKVFLPPLSFLTSGIHLKDKKWVLREEFLDAQNNITLSEIAVAYGELIEVALDFLIVGFTVFMVVKAMNKLRQKSQDPANKTEVTPKDIDLLNDLKGLMQEQNELLKKKGRS